MDYNVLIISDDYAESLIQTSYYQDAINFHDDEPKFYLSFDEKIDFEEMNKYDLVVFDFGMIGNLDQQKINKLFKMKNLLVTSAMPENYIRGEDCYLPYVDFRIEMMYIDLINYVKRK